MKAVLIFPPSADPTAPYISIPALTGHLRSGGVDVVPIDANIEGYLHLLRGESLSFLADRVRGRRAELSGRKTLSHPEALEFARISGIGTDARRLTEEIEEALGILRDERFYDRDLYTGAVAAVEEALALVSSAYYPLELSFTSYRTPFALLGPDEIARESLPDRNPFADYVERLLIPRIEAVGADLIGFSAAFTSQVQLAFSFAAAIRRAIPEAYLTIGGPAVTQLFAKHPAAEIERFLGPFDSMVMFEGETVLEGMMSDLRDGRRPHGALSAERATDLRTLASPDFEGLPISSYLSPSPVLPYDPSRGCYWGKCAFCRYGLAERGTARYRERRARTTAEHLSVLAERYRCRVFYLSEDTIAPGTLLRIADELTRRAGADGYPLRWGTDIRGEASLDRIAAARLAAGGALAVSIGLESASGPLLSRINKGITAADMRKAVRSLSEAGIAVEIMCFSGFPGETVSEALETVAFLEEEHDNVALFMYGEFVLTEGSDVAADPGKYGIRETWRVRGDELGIGLFYTPGADWKDADEEEAFEEALDAVSHRWSMRSYPWAGSLSTAHTLLMYDRFGPAAFRTPPKRGAGKYGKRPVPRSLERIRRTVDEREAAVWQRLVSELRSVSREDYEREVSRYPRIRVRG